MPENQCPQCGAALADEAEENSPCAACLMQLGLQTWARRESGGLTADLDRGGEPAFVAPSIAELNDLFPQLEVLEFVGQGGMGAVYKARQRSLDRVVALKIINPRTASDADFAERFQREAHMLGKINHPNVVGIYDFGEAGDLFYFLMEYVDGTDLRHLIATGELQPHEALKIVPAICEALQFAHEEGVVHRDIKPENILVDRRGRVKIADFGLAKLLGRSPSVSLTGTRQVMGTFHYMAPEQIEQPGSVDHRADIYALGVVFYEMLTGHLPMGRFQPPSHRADIDNRVDEVVLRALEREPDERFQQASEVSLELDHIAREKDPSVAPNHAPAASPTDLDRQTDKAAQDQLRAPSHALLVGGIIGLSATVITMLFLLYRVMSGDYGRMDDDEWMWIWLQGFTIPATGIVIVAAMRAPELRSRGMTVVGCFIAMLPLNFGFPATFPLGLWCLTVLLRPEVRDAFRRHRMVQDRRAYEESQRAGSTQQRLKAATDEQKLDQFWEDRITNPDLLTVESVRQQLVPLGTGLMLVPAIAGIIGSTFLICLIVWERRLSQDELMAFAGGLAAVAIVVSFLVYAARQLITLGSYEVAMAGAICATILGPATFFIATVIGGWAISMLRRPEVRAAFLARKKIRNGSHKLPLKSNDAPTLSPAKTELLQQEMIGPSVALTVIGCLLLVLGLTAAVVISSNLRRMDEGHVVILFASVLGGLAVVVAILIGSRQMRRFGSYDLAVASAVLVIIVSPITYLLILPFGIWALHTLRNPIVRLAFAEHHLL